MAEPSAHSVEALDKVAAALAAEPSFGEAWGVPLAVIAAAVLTLIVNAWMMRRQFKNQWGQIAAQYAADQSREEQARDRDRQALATALHGELWYIGKVSRIAIAVLVTQIDDSKGRDVGFENQAIEVLKPARMRVADSELGRLGLLGHKAAAQVTLALGRGADLAARISMLQDPEEKQTIPVTNVAMKDILHELWDYHSRLLTLNETLAGIALMAPHDWSDTAAKLAAHVEHALDGHQPYGSANLDNLLASPPSEANFQ